MSRLSILLIDDDTSITETLSSYLEGRGYDVTVLNDGDESLEYVRTGRYPVIVTDIYIDRVTGLDILREAKAANSETVVIIMTARGSIRTTVEAETEGAFEYLAKPFPLKQLADTIARAQLSLRRQSVAENAEDFEQFGGMIGFSPPMVEVYKRIARFAKSADTVLITGESGTGKELVARALHDHSSRSGKPFLPVDCGAVPGPLWESELFGVMRGAFTGADRDRTGILETASGGTVFLDEVGEIPLEFQPKLLRFLQEQEYRPVGSPAVRRADVRVVAATNRPLDRMIRDGSFREDLFQRLDVLRVDVPPLRQRTADIPFLAQRFLERAIRSSDKSLWFEEGVLELFQRYNWPGNVRELENLIVRLAALNPPGPILAADVQPLVEEPDDEASTEPSELDARERQQIFRVLEQVGGNKTKAAEILGVQRRTLYKKLARFERENKGHTGAPQGHGESGEPVD